MISALSYRKDLKCWILRPCSNPDNASNHSIPNHPVYHGICSKGDLTV